MRSGRCQCAAVRFEFDGEPADAGICHCTVCRRLSGSAFMAYCGVETSAFRVVGGEGELSTYDVTDRLEKSFCRRCGSLLFTRHGTWPRYTYVCLGALDEGHGIVPGYHQFTGSKAAWFTIDDGLPTFERWEGDPPAPR